MNPLAHIGSAFGRTLALHVADASSRGRYEWEPAPWWVRFARIFI